MFQSVSGNEYSEMSNGNAFFPLKWWPMDISSYGDYPFPEQFSVFRELMERYFNAILFVNFFLTPGNTTVLRHISDYATTCNLVNIESWPSMPRSRATRPRSSEAAAILE